LELCKASVQMSPPTNHHLVFLQAGCPSCRPSNGVKAPKATKHSKLPLNFISCKLPSVLMCAFRNSLMQMTVNLLITAGNSDDIDQLTHAVRSRRKHVRLVTFPPDIAVSGDPRSYLSVLLTASQGMTPSRKQMLLLLPW